MCMYIVICNGKVNVVDKGKNLLQRRLCLLNYRKFSARSSWLLGSLEFISFKIIHFVKHSLYNDCRI